MHHTLDNWLDTVETMITVATNKATAERTSCLWISGPGAVVMNCRGSSFIFLCLICIIIHYQNQNKGT